VLHHRFRRLTLTGAAVGTLLVGGTAGLASANVSPAKVTETRTACVKDTGDYKAKLCLNVDATSVGSGKWKINRVSATISEAESNDNGKDGYFCFHFYGYNPAKGTATNEDCDVHPGTPELTHVWQHRRDNIYPYDPQFWDTFNGSISVKVDIAAGGYSRPDVGYTELEFN
jgi:hypothetical protein